MFPRFQNRHYGYAILLMVLFVANGCSKANFKAISSEEKLSTLQDHTGFSDQGDNGLSEGFPTDQSDGGLSGNPIDNTDGGLSGRIIDNFDGGLSNSSPNNGDGGANPSAGNNDFGQVGQYGQPTGGLRNPFGQTTNGGCCGDTDRETDLSQGRIQVIRYCRTADRGVPMAESESMRVIVKEGNNIIHEESGIHLLEEAIQDGRINLTDCDLSDKNIDDLTVEVVNEEGESLANIRDFSERQDTFDSDGLHLLFKNQESRLYSADENCDVSLASPLVVDMRNTKWQRQRPIKLTSPEHGVLFDILGINATPEPYTARPISWFRNPNIMPIVLPNSRGQVEGINQLFGNNTVGPDESLAENGFAALAKFDNYDAINNVAGYSDGYITAGDEVFAKLKLWKDSNLNGRSEPGELISLYEAGVQAIDLRFDPNYHSVDRHGNEIKYKSVIQFEDQQLRPVFDIWFVLKNHK